MSSDSRSAEPRLLTVPWSRWGDDGATSARPRTGLAALEAARAGSLSDWLARPTQAAALVFIVAPVKAI